MTRLDATRDSLLPLGVFTRYAAIVAALHLLVAGVAVWIANGHTT